MYLARPNLGQPLITSFSNLASGIDFIIVSEPGAKASDIKSLVNDILFIKPVDDKKISFPLNVTNVQKAKVNHREDSAFGNIGTHLIDCEVFGTKKKTAFWNVTVRITADSNAILKGRKKRLFDVRLAHESYIKENNHALCVYESIGDTLSFRHSSDLHLAKRNDEILKQIKYKAPPREFENESKGFINFNENFQNLIQHINHHSDEIDFLVVSGDVVDYYQPDEFYKQNSGVVCSFSDSNWSIFMDAVLGNGGLNKNHELTVPIFTTTGNHDFRVFHYNLKVRDQFKSFGLTNRLTNYLEEKHIDATGSINADLIYLKDYFKCINPDLNYLVHFGNTDLIFLDGGQDNYTHGFMDALIGGSPDTDCVTDSQMELIKSYFESKKGPGPIVIIVHTPPVNIKGENEKQELYENYLRKKTGKPWIDRKDNNLSFGSLAHNWKTFLEVLTGLTNQKKYIVDLVLSGHAHQNIEFRLQPYYHRKDKRYEVGIYCWDYSNQLLNLKTPEERRQWWEKNKPFILQTAATGPTGKYEPEIRKIVIENDQVKEMTTKKLADLK